MQIELTTSAQGAQHAQEDHDAGCVNPSMAPASMLVASGRSQAGGTDEYWLGYYNQLIQLGYQP